MVRRTEKQVLILSTFALFYFGRAFSPNCSFRLDSAQWSLNGVCIVITNHSDGWCKWKQEMEEIHAQKKWRKENVETVNITAKKSSSSNHYIWNCSKAFPLNIANVFYKYKVFYPHPYPQTWFEAFVVKIVDPGQPVLRNCPQFYKEKKIVTCECSSERDGEPRPVFSWPGETNSSILQLLDIRHQLNKTYTCQMSWRNETKTVLYEHTMWSKDGDDMNSQTTSSSLVQIIGVAGCAVFVIAIVTIATVVVIIRRTRKSDRKKNVTADEQGTVSMGTLPNSGNNEDEPIHHSYYVGFQLDTSVDFKLEGNEYEDFTTSTKHVDDPIQPDLYAVVDTKKGSQTTHRELYAVVEKNKDTKQAELYASVAKPSQEQQTMTDKTSYCSKKDDFISEGDVYAVVDKKIKP